MPRPLKTSLALAAIATAALGLSACASSANAAGDASQAASSKDGSAEVLLVATGASPKPYTYLDENDELTGYDIELLKLIDEKLDDVDFK